MGLSSVADLPKRATAFCNEACLTLTQDRGDPLPRLDGEVQPIARGPMIKPTCTLRLHGAQSISNLPSGKGRVPIELLEVNRFVSGLLESCGELFCSPTAIMLRPVFPPGIRPQGQRCARVRSISPLIVESDVDLGRLVSFPQEGVGTRRSISERIVAPLLEFSTRHAEHCVLCLLFESGYIANHRRRVQGATCNQLDTMEQMAQAASAGFQICFQDHASGVRAQSLPDVLDDANTLLDPSVALDGQSWEFQARKQTGPKAAFLINEMFLHGRDALNNRFETKLCLRSSPKKSLLVRRFGLTFRQQEILRRTGNNAYTSRPASGTGQDQG